MSTWEDIAPALGMSFGDASPYSQDRNPQKSSPPHFHEVGHELLHKAERRTATTKTVRETEAEAIAFVVAKTIGLDPGSASAFYIHLYHGNATLLAESLDVSRRPPH